MKFFNNKIDIFWILQIAGWSTLHLVYFFLYSRSLAGGQIAWLLLFITQVTGFIVSSLLRYIYRKIDFQAESVTLFTLKILFWVLITSNVWFWIDGFFSQFINEQFFKDLTLNRYFSFVWSNTVIMSAWSALYFSIKFWQNWNLQRLKTEKANSLAHKSQLKLLRYQLNPHFLFNSLNSIRALIEEDKSRAKSMITELSEFLRYSLVNKNLSDIPLKDELEIMKHYF